MALVTLRPDLALLNAEVLVIDICTGSERIPAAFFDVVHAFAILGELASDEDGPDRVLIGAGTFGADNEFLSYDF